MDLKIYRSCRRSALVSAALSPGARDPKVRRPLLRLCAEGSLPARFAQLVLNWGERDAGKKQGKQGFWGRVKRCEKHEEQSETGVRLSTYLIFWKNQHVFEEETQLYSDSQPTKVEEP